MTEYIRSDKGKIQADLALRVGKLLSQYGDLTRHLGEEEKDDATLLICALQTLLVNCHALLDAMKNGNKDLWRTSIDNGCDELEISGSLDIESNFPGVLTRDRFVEHLRNAVSHPTHPDHKTFYRSTGYTTVPDDTGIISKFAFVDSPWINRGEVFSWVSSTNQAKVERCKDGFVKKNCGDIELSVVRNADGKYEICRNRNVYLPVFELSIAVTRLRTVAVELANYVAQPTIANWDGKTIHRLVA